MNLKREIIKHILVTSLILGSLAVFMWLTYVFIKFRFDLTADIPLVWLIGLAIVGLLISVILYPANRFLLKGCSGFLRIAANLVLGTITVFCAFAVLSNYPVNFEYMVKRLWLYYLIFSVVGALYGFCYTRYIKGITRP